MEENELTSSQKLLRFAIVFFIVIWLSMFITGCASTQQIDKCCETDIVYLEDIKSGTTTFSTLNFTVNTSPGCTGSGVWETKVVWIIGLSPKAANACGTRNKEIKKILKIKMFIFLNCTPMINVLLSLYKVFFF